MRPLAASPWRSMLRRTNGPSSAWCDSDGSGYARNPALQVAIRALANHRQFPLRVGDAQGHQPSKQFPTQSKTLPPTRPEIPNTTCYEGSRGSSVLSHTGIDKPSPFPTPSPTNDDLYPHSSTSNHPPYPLEKSRKMRQKFAHFSPGTTPFLFPVPCTSPNISFLSTKRTYLMFSLYCRTPPRSP